MPSITTLISLLVAATAGGALDQALSLLDAVDESILSVTWHDARIEDVLDELGQQLPAPVRADWDALERLGVRADDRVSFKLDHASGSTVLAGLRLLLADEIERPIFEVHAGQVVLTTLSGSEPMRLTGVYDVRDLLREAELIERLRQEAPPIQVSPPETAPAERSEDDAAPPPPAGDDPAAEPARPEEPANLPPTLVPRIRPVHLPDLEETIRSAPAVRPLGPGEALLTLVMDHVDPEAWMNFGGSRAKVSERDGVVVVTATASTHRRLREALALLRAANPSSIRIDARIIDLPRTVLEQKTRRSAPGSIALATALMRAPEGIALWRTRSTVALDSQLRARSADSGVQVQLAVRPRFDAAAGVLSLEIEIQTQLEADVRGVETTVTIAGLRGAATLEIPAASPGEEARLLVLLVERR